MFKSARFVPFWFIMNGFAPSKLRVPKLSILKITVAIFAPSPFLDIIRLPGDLRSVLAGSVEEISFVICMPKFCGNVQF